ncbi:MULTISPECIES: DUF938 domain-containing protein [Pseudoalteromonas]|uniref:Methylase n=1 Tax=Pseudoalteromonas amylolytica TaxID=1859457 RepID=A0A1S1N2P7_9GAMM|nr:MULTISPECIES: DUF938 domain-containing protein [Pseudoalteromonas]MCF6437338.1 class I SAM-dependent methyltransferase [Pseudoalteromonas sp. MMG022]OHU84627.1 methylase [Pseudoalteromonas sp. JW3]OHU92464.1 methylase [Pseudoalteromonas amylolytica]
MNKPFSQACENNKTPILSVLKPYLEQYDYVLEVGSGTGQHAVYFAESMPHLVWQTSDRLCNHEGIEAWLVESSASNVRKPLSLDLNQPWPVQQVPVIFTANTLHIVSKALVEKLFVGVAQHLANGGLLCIYGPFNYDGAFTSASNAAFDSFLKTQDSQSGIRDIEWVCAKAQQAGLKLLQDHKMPANNRLLLFKR